MSAFRLYKEIAYKYKKYEKNIQVIVQTSLVLRKLSTKQTKRGQREENATKS